MGFIALITAASTGAASFGFFISGAPPVFSLLPATSPHCRSLMRRSSFFQFQLLYLKPQFQNLVFQLLYFERIRGCHWVTDERSAFEPKWRTRERIRGLTTAVAIPSAKQIRNITDQYMWLTAKASVLGMWMEAPSGTASITYMLTVAKNEIRDGCG